MDKPTHLQCEPWGTPNFVEYAVYQFQIAAENGGQRAEYVLRRSSDN